MPIRWKAYLFAVTASIFLVTSSSAQSARPARLSGTYKIESVKLQGRNVLVFLKIRLVNGSGSDFSDATVKISDQAWRAAAQSSAQPLELQPHSSASFLREFIVPRQEYERWRRGARPVVSVQAARPAGHRSTAMIRLSENQPSGRK